jgi:polyribonucleotide nucleotidyltransferase
MNIRYPIYEGVYRILTKGQACKPFLLPQKDTDFYFRFMKSYNIPEFITGEVKRQGRALAVKAKEDKGVDLRFK